MKTLHLVVTLFVLLLFSMGLSKQNVYAENQNPPVIITQVELGSPLVLLPDNQSCTSPPDPKSTNNCLADLVPGHKVQCGYSRGSTCEPLHHWTSGTNQSCLEGYPQGGAPQWFDMYNTSGMIVDLQNFTVFNKLNFKPYGSMGPFSTILELRPHEKCTFSWLPMDQALYMGLNNISMAISYNYDGKYYNVSTPSLSDTYNDTRTWQLDNNKWIFAQNETGVGNQFPIGTPFKSTQGLPLKQFKSGIAAKDVICRQGLQLIFKFEDSSPACVTKQTVQTLVERWWGMYVPAVTEHIPILSNSIMVRNTNSTINYDISGSNKLLDAKMDSQSKSLILSLKSASNGTLVVSIPRVLLDAKTNDGQDDQFIVLEDGQEINYNQINSTIMDRTLSIQFQSNAPSIEIIAIQIV